MTFRVLLVVSVLAACGSSPGDQSDAGLGSGDGSIEPDAAPQCTPVCEPETNADVACTVFNTCESSCSTGYARCGDDCVAESPTQCGAGCTACLDPSNGAAACSDGVCGVTCDAGFVACNGGVGCCPYADDLVAPEQFGGYLSSIAVDAQNHIHVAHVRIAENELVYTTETATGVAREVVIPYWNSSGGMRFELGLAARGPVVMYTDASKQGLHLAERRTTGWSLSTVVEGTRPQGWALAIDRGGRAHACFTSMATGALTYARRVGDRWTFVPVGTETDAKGPCAIAVDDQGLPHIAFERTDAAGVAYATADANGVFTTTVVDATGNGREVAIAVTPTGIPTVVAYRADTMDLHVLTLSGGTWSSQTIANAIRSPNIAFDTAGAPMITWYDIDRGRVAFATLSGATWTTKVFESISRGAGDLAPGPDGAMWVATGDREILAHRFVNGAPESTLEVDLEDKTGGRVVIVHPTPQQSALIYETTRDNAITHVEIATRSGGTWTRRQLATRGYSPAAAVDPNGKLRIVYQMQTAASLLYAEETGASFAIEPITTTGTEASIDVDAQGTPYVAYIADQGGSMSSLVLATRGASGWTPVTIGAAAPVNTYRVPKVRVVNGVVHLLWQDGIAKSVVYASSANSYTKVTIESNADGGSDLYVTPAGVPHACAFRQGSPRTLRYLTRPTTSWTNFGTFARGGDTDRGVCAIGVDANGTVGIARYVTYGAGFGATLLTTNPMTPTQVAVHDDFYSSSLDVSVGANGFEIAANGQPYSGVTNDQNRVRWAHK